MLKYKYLGTEETNLIGFGPVQPGQVIEVESPINHPLFEPVKKEENTKKISGKPV